MYTGSYRIKPTLSWQVFGHKCTVLVLENYYVKVNYQWPGVFLKPVHCHVAGVLHNS